MVSPQVAQLDQTQAEHREHISGYLELREEYAKKRPTFDVDPIYCYLRSSVSSSRVRR